MKTRISSETIREFFLGEKKPFISKREVNWARVRRVLIGAVVFTVMGILIMPTSKDTFQTFHEKVDHVSSTLEQQNEMTPTDGAIHHLAQGVTDLGSVPRSLDYLYAEPRRSSDSGANHETHAPGQNSGSMIVTRGGVDSHTQLPPGSRLKVRLLEKAAASDQAIPIIGEVTSDVVHNDTVAIASGARVYGELTFDSSSERGSATFRSIRLADGRERPFTALAAGEDGRTGVAGRIRSEAVKNAIGQTLTRFLGAYAEGSMERGSLGGNPGGARNGLKNAISETAQSHAESFGEALSTEKKWLELPAGSEFLVILNQAFTFREPGSLYGR